MQERQRITTSRSELHVLGAELAKQLQEVLKPDAPTRFRVPTGADNDAE